MICLTYLGTRGGGSSFALDVIECAAIQKEKFGLVISALNENMNLFQEISQKYERQIELVVVHPLKKNSFTAIQIEKYCEFVNLMHSPRDYLFMRWLRKNRLPLIQVVHDLYRHPGDLWPTNFSRLRRLKSAEKIICLSVFVKNQLLRRGFVASLYSINHGLSKYVPPVEPGKILIIGRLKKYQGAEKLKEISSKLKSTSVTWQVAGRGKVNKRLLPKNTILVNRWLSNEEMESMIASCHIVLLPYTSASQSGVLAMATKLGKPAVVTPVGALVEQVINGQTGLISKSTSPEDIAQTLDLALEHEWSETWPNQEKSTKLNLVTYLKMEQNEKYYGD